MKVSVLYAFLNHSNCHTSNQKIIELIFKSTLLHKIIAKSLMKLFLTELKGSKKVTGKTLLPYPVVVCIEDIVKSG